MADQRGGGISWTDETWNPIRGCRRVNDDCRNCYAERLAATRLSTQPKYKGLAVLTPSGPRWTGKIRLDEADLLKPLHWQRPRMVFTNAMSDLFYEDLGQPQIDRIVAVMVLAHQHTFQVLTKRPDRMAAYLNDINTPDRVAAIINAEHNRPTFALRLTTEIDLGNDVAKARARRLWPARNIWWGASAGHQAALDALLPHLRACRATARVLWLSAEPLHTALPLRLDPWLWTTCPTCGGTMSVPVPGGGAPCPTCLEHQGVVPAGVLDWVVGGGESGPEARPTWLHVARQLRDDVTAAGVAFHWKQNGEYDLVTGDRRGRGATGRELDGVIWNEYPKVA